MHMGGTMVCVQRCFEPRWFFDENVKDQVYLLISLSFTPNDQKSNVQRLREEHENIDGYAWDFVFLIFDAAYKKVLGCCFVDIRDTRAKGKMPYLYVCDLCTDSEYAHLSFGTQMVHGVQTLASMMLAANSPWKGVFSRGLYLGLTVNPADDTNRHISRMYERCGFSLAKKGGPLDFTGYTPYIPYLFLFESKDRVPMHMRVEDEVMYQDAGMRVYVPSSQKGCEMYHAFPEDVLDFVKKYGLVCPNQAKRVLADVPGANSFQIKEREYTALGVWFSKTAKRAQGRRCFVIRASSVDGSCPESLVSQGVISWMLAVRVE
jgi:ribosomal protein S18 acetylase RimI-like enzyme